MNDGNLGISNHRFFRQARRFAYLVERKRQRGMGTRPRRTAELLVQETGRNDGGQSCLASAAALCRFSLFSVAGPISLSRIARPAPFTRTSERTVQSPTVKAEFPTH